MSPAPRRLRRDGRWPFQEIEGLAVVVVPERREVHQLDAVGTFVWALLRDPHSPEELAAAVAGEFEVDPDRALSDLTPFLESLQARGLVTIEAA
jgi:hypothetical protein